MQVTRLGGDWSAPAVNFFNNLGKGGVALFFMTTGLVFYPRVLAGFSRTSWLATYISRVFRIIPLIVISVALITVIIILRTGQHIDGNYPMAAAKWIASWGEPPLLGYEDSGRLNAYVLWSLWYEWMFYIFVLPACALGMDFIRGRMPSWVLPVALLITSLFVRKFYSLAGMSSYLPLFAIGMLAFECREQKPFRLIMSMPSVAVLASSCLAIAMNGAPTPFGILQLPLYGFFFTAVACGNSFFRLLGTRGALLLGECSYSIYLLHGTILSLLFVEGAPLISHLSTNQIPALLPLAAIVIAGVTAASYLLIERPTIYTGKLVAKRLSWRRVSPNDPQVEVGP